MIKNLWVTTLRLYRALNEQDLRSYSGSLLRKHVPAILNDPIMQ